jgi:hypothetical protein
VSVKAVPGSALEVIEPEFFFHRETIPPSRTRSAALFSPPRVPPGYRPRGSTIAA